MSAVPIMLEQRAMFIPHSGYARSGLSKLDEFAEHLANGLSVPEAARAVGWQSSHGNSMLQRIRKQLGEQAK
jgi:hypothetical protein